MNKEKKNYGISARIGERFHKELEEIKREKIKNGTSKELVSTEILTNMFVRHKSFESQKKHIIEENFEELDKYGDKK